VRRSWGHWAALAAALAVVALFAPWPVAARAQEPDRALLDTRQAAASAPAPSASERAARRHLARRAAVSVDRVTGTVRAVQARDGALTGVAAGDRAAVALRWVREHRTALGLTARDVDALALTGRDASPATGITHLRFRQADRGIPAFDGGLRVSLDRGGRILSVTGAPVSGLEARTVVPRLDAAAALRALQRDVGSPRPVDVVSGPSGVRRETRFAGGDFARLVLFGRRLAWHLTYRATSVAHYDAVVDAASGAILFRQNLTKAQTRADVFPSHPGTALATQVNLEAGGWIAPTTNVLSGPYARVYSDLNDNDTVSGPEEITRTPFGDFQYPFTSFGNCGTDAKCSWNPASANSWQTNRQQNGVQAFYLVNRFRDHLSGDPNIGFDGFSGADAVIVETDDGASTGPNAAHTNNANMSTPPEGFAPRMQLYLWKGPGFRNINGGDSAAIVWHEYTHGLSNRLVTYADGSSALSSQHAGAMGEGWSDWYALDLLQTINGTTDLGHYTDAVAHNLRTQPIDTPVTGGGYTLGDFGEIAGEPDVHSDGEIWGQTLWDLRTRLGRDKAQALITEGMRMSPPEPSFVDMRNAILAAEAGLAGDDRATVWDVFSKRGMGYFAYAEDAADDDPTEDFSAPPASGSPRGRTSGTVTSADTGLPLANVAVGFGGLASATAFPDALVARTASNGAYAHDVPAGTYPELAFEAPGYERVSVPGFAVPAGGTRVQDVALRRDWAAGAGGAIVTGSDDTGASFGCGLDQLVDQRGDTSWSAFHDPGDPPTAVVRLPTAINVTAFGLDPSSACGNPPTAATESYRLEVSADGVGYTVVSQGAFSSSERVVVPVSAQGVRYVRLTLLSPQAAGSQYVDFSELEVFGGPPNRLPTGTLAASRVRLNPGATVDFAASFVDPDSRITGYDWDFDGNGTVDRSTDAPSTSFTYGAAGTFNATVAARDFRGGAGTATRQLTVTRPARPKITLPRRGSKGQLTFRVTCALRCSLTGTLKVDRRTVSRVRRTIKTTAPRRITLTLPRKVRRAARRRDAKSVRAVLSVTARYADGRRTTEKRTVRIRL
jgi:extracellular elastinolytic metalloproteinase